MSCWDNRGYREGRHGGCDPVISGASTAFRNASGNRRSALHEIPRNGSGSGCSRTARGVARQILIIDRMALPLGARSTNNGSRDKPWILRRLFRGLSAQRWFLRRPSASAMRTAHGTTWAPQLSQKQEDGCGKDVLSFVQDLAGTASELWLEILSFEIRLGLYVVHRLVLISKLNPGHHPLAEPGSTSHVPGNAGYGPNVVLMCGVDVWGCGWRLLFGGKVTGLWWWGHNSGGSLTIGWVHLVG